MSSIANRARALGGRVRSKVTDVIRWAAQKLPKRTVGASTPSVGASAAAGRWAQRLRAVWSQYRSPAIVFAAALSLVILFGNVLIRPSYTASTTIVVTEEGIENEWDLLRDESRDVDFEEQMHSRAVLEPVVRQLNLVPSTTRRVLWWPPRALTADAQQRALRKALKTFRKRLRVERLRHSGILRITVKASDPKRAATAANAVAQSFIDYRRGLAVMRGQQRLQALDGDLAAVRTELKSLAAARSALLARHGWDDYETERQLTVERVGALKGALRSLDSYAGFLGSTVPASAVGGSSLPQARATDATRFIDETSLQELAQQLGAADARLGQTMSRYKEGNPLVLQARREKEVLERVLRTRIQQRRAALEQRLASEQQQLHHLLSEEPQARTLDTAMAQAQQRYRELLDQQAEIRSSLILWKQPSATFGVFAVLDEALPPPARTFWTRSVAALAAIVLLGAAGLVTVPLLLTLWASRTRAAQPSAQEGPGRSGGLVAVQHAGMTSDGDGRAGKDTPRVAPPLSGPSPQAAPRPPHDTTTPAKPSLNP